MTTGKTATALTCCPLHRMLCPSTATPTHFSRLDSDACLRLFQICIRCIPLSSSVPVQAHFCPRQRDCRWLELCLPMDFGVFEWRAWLHRFSLHLSLPALCLLRGKIGLGFLSAMQINPCSRASLKWKLGSRYKEISLKCRLFPPCTRYSWTLVFAACFEDVISQAVAFSPLCSYFSRQEVESEVYGNRGRGQGLRRINFLMKYWKPIWS